MDINIHYLKNNKYKLDFCSRISDYHDITQLIPWFYKINC